MRYIIAVISLWLLFTPAVFAGNWGDMTWGEGVWGSDKPNEPVNCEHAVYSLKKKTLTVPYVEIPMVNFFGGQPTGKVELWTASLKRLSGVTNRFRLLSKTVERITDGSSTDCPATYTQAGTLSIPYVDVPTGVIVGNSKFGSEVETFEVILIWEPLGRNFIVNSISPVN
jgi:hypothetical protein